MRYVSTVTVTIDIDDDVVSDWTLGNLEQHIASQIEDTPEYVEYGKHIRVDTVQESEDYEPDVKLVVRFDDGAYLALIDEDDRCVWATVAAIDVAYPFPDGDMAHFAAEAFIDAHVPDLGVTYEVHGLTPITITGYNDKENN